MCELRSGLDPASTAGNPVCTTHTGRGRGVPSFLVTFFLGKQKEVTRPKGRNALALDLDDRSQRRIARSKKIAGGARSHKQQSSSDSDRDSNGDSQKLAA